MGRDARASGSKPFVLDDEKVAAAAKLDAEWVAVGDRQQLEFRSDPEREHVRAQDRAVEAMLESWVDGE